MLPGLLAIPLDGIAAVRRAKGALRCDAGSDSCRPSTRGTPKWSRTQTAGIEACFALPSQHPAPTIIWLPGLAFAVTAADRAILDFALRPQARRTTQPKRVRYPAGCSFASGCSPPRIAATQLPSATTVVTSFGLDFHQPDNATSQTHGLRWRYARDDKVCQILS